MFSRDEIQDLPVELHLQFFKSSDAAATLGGIGPPGSEARYVPEGGGSQQEYADDCVHRI